MRVPDKFPMVDEMRRTGGNFVRRLADAMVAADPQNYARICVAFPEIIEKYGNQSIQLESGNPPI